MTFYDNMKYLKWIDLNRGINGENGFKFCIEKVNLKRKNEFDGNRTLNPGGYQKVFFNCAS